MGISTVASYRGAQVFEAVGLAQDVVDEYFTGTTSRLGGIGLDAIAEEVARRHADRLPDRPAASRAHRELESAASTSGAARARPHLFNPETVFKLQHATRAKRYDIFKEYTQRVDDQSSGSMTLRGLFAFKDGVRAPVPLDEVEPVSVDRASASRPARCRTARSRRRRTRPWPSR